MSHPEFLWGSCFRLYTISLSLFVPNSIVRGQSGRPRQCLVSKIGQRSRSPAQSSFGFPEFAE